ncbi:MAG: protocatechuate 3,4-dioxygenase [Sedimenticola sp.]|nr:protocatechuate 3,4-dioxygenase [Sedimenticola sp.]
MSGLSRRHFLLSLAACSMPVLGAPRLFTPRQTAGPFYPDTPPLDSDNELVRVAGESSTALGEVTDLSGRLLDRNGRPLQGVRIEIWQCDANGRYHHPRDRGGMPRDSGFQGFGFTRADDQGRYRFRTIRPVPYPGRTPHIHVAVFPDGRRPFVTQLYVAGEPGNVDDFLYRRIAPELRELVTAEFRPGAPAGVEWLAEKDIILDVTPS